MDSYETTIWVHQNTKMNLRSCKIYPRETDEDVLKRLIKDYKKNNKK